MLNQGIPAWNERASDALPLDSRGGGAFDFFAPYDGTYEIRGYMNANTNNEVDRLEANRRAREVYLEAGPHSIGMSFRRDIGLDEQLQKPRNTVDIVPLPTAPPRSLTLDFIVDGARVGSEQVPSYYLSPRYAQHNFPRDVLQIDITGPLTIDGPGETLSRSRIFRCHPATDALPARECAREILTPLARLAWRGAVDDGAMEGLLGVFSRADAEADFATGIAAALQALLVSPRFLFVLEEIRRTPRPAPCTG